MPGPYDPAAARLFELNGWDFDRGVLVHRYALDGFGMEERFAFPHAERFRTGESFERACDLLHVAAGTSYYKAGAPGAVAGIPGWLSGFVPDLYLHGLAEFAMTNQLDPISPEFSFVGEPTCVPMVDDSGRSVPRRGEPETSGPALVAVGGGKDSIVTIESVKRARRPLVLGSVRTHRAIEETSRISGVEHLVIDRVIDPALIELNQRGALNGHIPVTAINSTALAVLAAGLGLSAVIMSNESSASVPLAEYRGLPVNHQWSKGAVFEALLARFVPVPCFSLLRPLHEVEVCRRFSALPQYFDAVTSCNHAYTAVGRAAGTRWCGDCPKCRFVFLALAAFLPPDAVRRIFDGVDLLSDPSRHAADAYRAIIGVGGEPPMECIGTVTESQWLVARLAVDPQWRDHAVVQCLAPVVSVDPSWNPLVERGTHWIPDEWQGAADALA